MKCMGDTNRPFEDDLVDMRFQERSKDQYVCYFDVFWHILGVLFAGSHCADDAFLVAHRLGGKRGRGGVADTVESVGQVRDGFRDLLHDIFV